MDECDASKKQTEVQWTKRTTPRLVFGDWFTNFLYFACRLSQRQLLGSAWRRVQVAHAKANRFSMHSFFLGIRNGYYPVVHSGHAALTLEASHHREQQSLTTAQPALCRLELPDACALFSPCGHATLFDCIVLRRSKEIQRETTCFWGSSSSKP